MTIDFKPTTDLQTAIKQRRAARSFRPEPIPDALLEKIFTLALYSPSGYNLQPWRFIAVRDPENRQKLQNCAFNQGQIGQAPIVLICCGDREAGNSDNIEAVIKLGKEHNNITEEYAEALRTMIPPFFENRPSFENLEAWTNRHTMLAVAHLMIVAKGFGVDSCPMEGFIQAQVKEAFNIPENLDICCLLPLGFADKPDKQYGGRFGINQVFFDESYGKPLEI